MSLSVVKDFESWIGRERTTRDTVSLSHARALAATLDRDPDEITDGSLLPHGWHWIYFNAPAPRSVLGTDGHEERGGFLPPIPHARRMWAGGTLTFPGRLRIGDELRRVSTVRSVEPKEGRSGGLVFVTVAHTLLNGTDVVLEERQDLVYRLGDPRGRDGVGSWTPPPLEWSEPFVADEVTLFRFSALTFNGHRIHYDHPYATEVEGYPGLVVHGPLLALLLLDAGVRRLPVDGAASAPRRFRYRALGPLYCNEDFVLGGAALEEPGTAPADAESQAATMKLWAVHPERGIATEATLEVDGSTRAHARP